MGIAHYHYHFPFRSLEHPGLHQPCSLSHPIVGNSATTVARLVAIMIAELEQQSANGGSLVEHQGTLAQVDGSFDMALLALAILKEMAR